MGKDSKKLGAAILMDGLEKEGTEFVFGYPGGAALPLFDALGQSKIRFILSRHEQGACHMADGYARASGKAGVVLVTSGPGATNTVTGIYTAQMDSVPMVVLCGQTAKPFLGKDAFQEVDIFGITLAIVKHSYQIQNANDIAQVLHEAFYLAQNGRPGPVLIDIPKDVGLALVSPCPYPKRNLPGFRNPDPANEISIQELENVSNFFEAAKKPLLLVGRGAVISRAGKYIQKLAEKLQAPVTNTLLGKGAFPETHALSLGMLGMHGTAYANKAVTECDLICSIGSRWDDRIVGTYETFCPQAKKIHIDIDPAEIGKVIRPDASLIGDAKAVLQRLIPQVKRCHSQEWLHFIAEYKSNHPIQIPQGKDLTAKQVIHAFYQETKGEALVATDVGQHQMWAAQVFRSHRCHSWLSSGGAGTMGFGMPAAIGAKLARPKETVLAFVGDGGFQMTQGELATALLEKLAIKIIVLDNQYLGMVRQWQELFFENRLHGVDMIGNPDFCMLAQSYGMKTFRIENSKELPKIVKEAMDYQEGPCLIHARITKEENVFPMIPAGKSLKEIILEPKGEKK